MSKTVFVLLLLISSLTNFAQEKIFLKDCKNLDSLSSVYYENGDSYFLVIDAYKQGLIKDGTDYKIVFNDNLLLLNDELFPQPFMRNEIEKLKIIAQKNNTVSIAITISPEKDKTKKVHVFAARKTEILKTESSTASYHDWVEHMDKEAELVKLLVAEKILQKPAALHISYNQKIILLNGKPMPTKLVDRYLPILISINKIPPPENKNEFTGFDIDKETVKNTFQSSKLEEEMKTQLPK